MLAFCSLSLLLVSHEHGFVALLCGVGGVLVRCQDRLADKPIRIGCYQKLMTTLNRLLLLLYDFVRVALGNSQFLDGLPLDVSPHTILDLLSVLFCFVKDLLAFL
jgi:hypothetical protein